MVSSVWPCSFYAVKGAYKTFLRNQYTRKEGKPQRRGPTKTLPQDCWHLDRPPEHPAKTIVCRYQRSNRGILCNPFNRRNVIWEQKIFLNWLNDKEKRAGNGKFLALDKHMQHSVPFFRKKHYIFKAGNLLYLICNSRST